MSSYAGRLCKCMAAAYAYAYELLSNPCICAQHQHRDGHPIIKAIDAGLDAFLSVPIERFFSAAVALKAATAEAMQADSCNLVCTPPLASVESVAGKVANALSITDSEKLKTFVYQLTRSVQSGDQKLYAT